MHPEVKQEGPGMCPECGMSLILEKDHKEHGERKEHDKHAGHVTQDFLKKFWVSLVLTVFVVLFRDSSVIPIIFGSIVFFYGGWIFIASALRELRGKSPGMMTLIALAISVAYIYSVFVVFRKEGEPLFWELTSLITVMLLGHWLEMRAVSGAQGALKELSKLLPDTAEVMRGEQITAVPLDQLKLGDIVLVRPGSRVPADGKVIEGSTEVNESMITGESKPVSKNKGNEVIAGTVNGTGSLKVEVTKIGKNTFLAGIMRLVSEAQASKSKLQLLSDKAAFLLTISAITLGTATFLFWLTKEGGFTFAVERLVAVLVIACPHALGLAIPLVASISTTLAARSGFLVRQRLSLELARNIDIVLFDKTGTLTTGSYGVTRAEDLVLQLAASVDAQSEHSAAKALVAEAGRRNLKLMQAHDFAAIPGKGAKAIIEGVEYRVEGSESQGAETTVSVFKGHEKIGDITLADKIREESREAVQKLKSMGVKIAMITGDAESVASWVAKELGIDEYFARVLPQEKSAKVKLLQERGLKVAMVGDGVNDAPALTQADLGVAIGAGTNVAIESAGIILVRNDPRDVAKIIKLSKITYTKMLQNLFWATGYNVVALPLAAGVLASQGIFLQPAVAAVFMSLSTVIVAINAVLLRRASL
ncbi:MAG: copper-translocating P-type ATPase [Candidatus Wildermuthbacteria bacterium]|nr:copper-translocating P-type ATPase [Candidatus Wildermuthbacteria bacterium]